ncbi:MAG: xanthine dehydrogenase family protein molybdopterin-binding subunit [Betaproteobacteria bacterium]|nr:xanthine dehydrogenase family protein molybdopterin-binding subunit [Betaproteobacteria bacterium]
MNRREFIATGGALIVSFSLPAVAQKAAEKLPGALEREPMLDAWIRVAADGRITVFTGKAELGQGIKTALLQIAAEQLSVPMSAIELVTADTARTPNEGYTAGSNSMKDSGTAVLHAAAQARALLVAEAAKRWGVAPEQVSVQGGELRGPEGKRMSYGAVVEGQLLHARAQPQSALATSRTVMGKPVQRVDIPAKVTGGAAYVHDLRLPDMLHARVVRPPSYGARLTSVEMEPVAKMAGVVKIVRDGSFLAVVAAREWTAVQASRALRARAQWQESAKMPRDIYATLPQLKSEDTVIAGGDTQLPQGARVIEAEYRRPYQIHGSIGPACAVARHEGNTLTVWTHSQGVYPLRGALAELMAMPAERIHCIHMEGAGCYGHNAADDVAGDAALIAREVPGKPVRVQWMREDEHAWEPFGPAMIGKTRATLDASGNVSGWQYDVWSNTHSSRPGKAGELAAAWSVSKPFQPSPPRPLPQPEGGGDRNAIPLYKFPSRVTHHFIPEMPVRVSALRALGAYTNVFSIESFMDELAAAAKADPVEYRLRHIDDARARDVIRMAAERFGWDKYQKQNGNGRGFGFARYKNLAAYCALAMEVKVDRETGDLRVLRVVAAVDSGEAVNPDGIRNQIEGGILQSVSWTSFEAVMYNDTRITSRDWGTYPILRFSHVPQALEVHLIDRPGQPFLGTGEAAQGPAAGALANALAHATGVRVRELPFSPRRLRAVLSG